MDFLTVKIKYVNQNKIELVPKFSITKNTKDLMIRGGAFYAVWDEENNMWSRDSLELEYLVDKCVSEKLNEIKKDSSYANKYIEPVYMADTDSHKRTEFHNSIMKVRDTYKALDQKLTFQDTPVTREDYVSKRLPYSLQKTEPKAWNEMMSVLYRPEERQKLEWIIGSVVANEAYDLQKFMVIYGDMGTGKGTVLEVIDLLFEGYNTHFLSSRLGNANESFPLTQFQNDPLVAIDSDCDLSHIETNELLNQVTGHDPVVMNVKFKNESVFYPRAMVILATNHPVKITNATAGIIRRLIDVEPTGNLIPIDHYNELKSQIKFELGSIAYHCMKVFKKYGKHYYDTYRPIRMMNRTDPFYNFMVDFREIIKDNIDEDGDVYSTATNIWNNWKKWCSDNGINKFGKFYEIREEASHYFERFEDMLRINGRQIRSVFVGLRLKKFEKFKGKEVGPTPESELENWIKMDQDKSPLDEILKDCKAQYAVKNTKGVWVPEKPWDEVTTTLKDLDTTRCHYILGLGQIICVDFDLHDETGQKSAALNLEAASKWPKTYAEFSNSGNGIHLYYIYGGDVKELSSIYDDEIEIKVYPLDSKIPLRRRVSKCNNEDLYFMSSGLPLKGEKKVIRKWKGFQDEQHVRNTVIKAIKKEIQPYGNAPTTTTCMKYIADVLKNAQDEGISYDLSDFSEDLYAFAANSHHNKLECRDIFFSLDLKWPKQEEPVGNIIVPEQTDEKPIVILDCEVVPNLTYICYKELEPDGVAAIYKKKEDRLKPCIRMFNPSAMDVEDLINNTRIVGHNAKGYDNFILYAKMLGYNAGQVAEISDAIINKGERNPFREAKHVSWTDTFDVSSDKKGLKKIEIEMHLPHKEMEIDWKAPLPESEWDRLADYCENDVLATEAYFLSKDWQADFKARKILAALTGLTVNDSTNDLTAQLIFGDEREPWKGFVYPDLQAEFPLYRFKDGKSYFGDELIGEGGRVYAETGQYFNVTTFDVAGMHPTSVIVENGFGEHTKGYQDLYKARIAIKHKDYDSARKMFDGKLAPYLQSDEDADALSHALKIALNSVYGMTAAHFQNRFKDPRNVDNWVAKRGALFMETLRRKVQGMGGHVIHIKTDSIKLVNPTDELKDFVVNFGKEWGYTFEIESHYDRICLVNNAVYIAYRAEDDPSWLKECKKAKQKWEATCIAAKEAGEAEPKYVEPTRWTATGAQFAHPFVFKQLFSKEPKEFWDYCETKTVKTDMYLDLNEGLPDVSQAEKDLNKLKKRWKVLIQDLGNSQTSYLDKAKINAELDDLEKDQDILEEEIAKGHSYLFVGKAGQFCPIKPGMGGGELYRKNSDGGFGYVTGAKDYRWLESENLKILDNWKYYIDLRYFRHLVDEAKEAISAFGSFDDFVSGIVPANYDSLLSADEVQDVDNGYTDPWMLPCGTEEYAYCSDCPHFSDSDEHPGYCCRLGYNIENQILGLEKSNESENEGE